jgi:hypothetical protein
VGTFNVGSPTACKQECSTAHADRTGHTCNDVGYGSAGTADAAGTTLGAVNENSDIAVADGTYLRARIRLLDMYDERQWQAQFGESKPRQVICSPPFEVDLSSPSTGWVAAGIVPPDDHTKLICIAALWITPLVALRSFFVCARKLAQSTPHSLLGRGRDVRRGLLRGNPPLLRRATNRTGSHPRPRQLLRATEFLGDDLSAPARGG